MFYSALSELHETERLIIFFNQKEFWVIPKRALGGEDGPLWKRELEEKIFHGYYGRNIYMTSCLVLMDREMTTEEIEACLDQVKKIKNTSMFAGIFKSGNGCSGRCRRKCFKIP